MSTFAVEMTHQNSEYIVKSTPSGLRVVYRYAESDVSYCGFAVNAGARDEKDLPEGIAHYVEHMLFKGTKHHRASYILNRMESVGGEINAYTEKEETVIYSILLEPDLKRAVTLMSDIMQNSSFPDDESKKEKEVILDEIDLYKDNPSELIWDEFENYLFCGNELGHNILGDTDSLQSIKPSDGVTFMQRYYTPSNMVFFFSGKTDFRKVLRLLEECIEQSSNSSVQRVNRVEPKIYNAFNKIVKCDNHQSHTIIGGRCCNMFDAERYSLALVNNMLGGPGMNSLLNVALREKHGYVYTVESSVTSYSDAGVFGIYFGCDHRDKEKCLNLISKIFDSMRKKGLSSAALYAAKKQFIGQLAIGRENRESLTVSSGKSILHLGYCSTFKDVVEKIEAITPQEILDTANRLFSEDNISTLTLE